MKRIALFFVFLSTAFVSTSQVSQSILVEHFTNSRCSICASRNPGLHQNIANQPNTIRITFHPSSPYSNCELNKLNTSENDARTNYYGIYGGTPRVVVNGNVAPTSAKYDEASLFDPFENQTTPIDISAVISQINGSVQVEVTLSAEATHSYSTEKISVFLVHDVYAYDAPNGEKEHYNVFLDALTATTGDDIVVPAASESDRVVTVSTSLKSTWNADRLRAVVVLQDADNKSVIQSVQTATLDGTTNVRQQTRSSERPIVFPNPSSGGFFFLGLNAAATFELFNMQGQALQKGETDGADEVLSNIEPGMYFLHLYSNGKRSTYSLIKK